jgi:predicted phage gp36 major capsid-like protein
MTYGRSTRAPARNALVQKALARASGTWGGYQAWRQLDSEDRLQLVEKALGCAANDCIDGFPIAL